MLEVVATENQPEMVRISVCFCSDLAAFFLAAYSMAESDMRRRWTAGLDMALLPLLGPPWESDSCTERMEGVTGTGTGTGVPGDDPMVISGDCTSPTSGTGDSVLAAVLRLDDGTLLGNKGAARVTGTLSVVGLDR